MIIQFLVRDCKMTKNAKNKQPFKKIARLAEKISNDAASIDEQFNLLNLIEKYLKAGDDDTLSKAIDEVNTDKARDILEFHIADSTETRYALLASGEAGEAALFAIPIVMCVFPGEEFPVSLDDMSITKSFRKHGLIGINPSLILHKDFFQLDDLNLQPSERYNLTGKVLKIIENPQVKQGSLRQVPVKQKEHEDKVDVILRFLVGMTITDLDEIPFDSDNEEKYELSVDAWQDEIGDEIVKQTGIETIIIGEPFGLDSALRQGVDLFQEYSLNLKANDAVVMAAEKRSLCHAVIGMFADDENTEIRISFIDDNNDLIDGFAWKVLSHNDDEYISDKILSILKDNGVDGLATVEEVMPPTYHSDGSPEFLTPEDDVFEKRTSTMH